MKTDNWDGVGMLSTTKEYAPFKLPEHSEWQCFMFGMGKLGICFRPLKGKEPNRFWRWMQYICFGNDWVRVKVKHEL